MNQPIEGEQYAYLWANAIETSEAVSYEKLPSETYLPSPWQVKIQELVEKTREENREFGVVGYFSAGKPGSQNIRFGKVTRGKEDGSSVRHYLRERKMFVLPLGFPALLIHTHPPYHLRNNYLQD